MVHNEYKMFWFNSLYLDTVVPPKINRRQYLIEKKPLLINLIRKQVFGEELQIMILKKNPMKIVIS